MPHLGYVVKNISFSFFTHNTGSPCGLNCRFVPALLSGKSHEDNSTSLDAAEPVHLHLLTWGDEALSLSSVVCRVLVNQWGILALLMSSQLANNWEIPFRPREPLQTLQFHLQIVGVYQQRLP
jgi:hypothetical protein